jgi:hypothetical protein
LAIIKGFKTDKKGKEKKNDTQRCETNREGKERIASEEKRK